MPVPGIGPLNAEVMVVGEFYNDEIVPFATDRLRELLALAGFDRSQCYLTYAVKHRGETNAAAIKMCQHYLMEEVRTVRPSIIFTLGKAAVTAVLGKTNLRKHGGIGIDTEFFGEVVTVIPMMELYPPPVALAEQEKEWREVRISKRPEVAEVDYETAISGDVIAVDLETTGLDPEVDKIVGVCLSSDPCSGFYAAFPEDVPALIPMDKRLYVFHNAPFDLAFLRKAGVLIPEQRVWDTMVSGAVLGVKTLGLKERVLREHSILMSTLGEISDGLYDFDKISPELAANYGRTDAAMTFKLYEADKEEVQKRGIERLFGIEMELQPVLALMKRRGMYVDEQALEEAKELLSGKMEQLESVIHPLTGGINFNSTDQLQEFLFGTLKLPPLKKTKKGYSVDEETLKALSSRHPAISSILEWRKYAKLQSTYVGGLLAAKDSKGYVHPTFKQTGAETGRFSCAAPNVQNQPARDDWAKNLIRGVFQAPSNCYILSIDYSQVELRIVAALAMEHTMLDVFRNNGDIHTDTATRIKVPRPLAKNLNFGMCYGLGANGFRHYLRAECDPPIYITREEAQVIIDNFIGARKNLSEWIARTKHFATENLYTETVLGRRRYFPTLDTDNVKVLEKEVKQAVNHPVQGTAADIMKAAMVKLIDYPIICTIHDELLFLVHESDLEEVMHDAKRVMEEVAEDILGGVVPIVAEAKYAKRWSECK